MFEVKKRTSTIVCAISAAKKTAEPRTLRRKNATRNKPENAAVENRAENVAGFDQVLDQVRERGDGDRDQSPGRREPSGRDDVMMVARLRAE